MDIASKTVRVSEKVFEECGECIREAEIVIPDYYPEITKVVRAEAWPMVRQSRMDGSRLEVEGNLRFVLLYQSNGGKELHSYTFQTEFSHAFELPGEIAGSVRARAKTEYAGCRPLSGRKGLLKAVLSVYADVTAEKQIVLPDAESGEVLMLKKTAPTCELVGRGEKIFKISETGELDAGQEPAAAALRTEAFALFKEQKIINNKVIAKGEVHARTLYADEDGRIDAAAFAFPFSQIVDVEGVDDGCDCSVKFTLCDMNVELGEAADGGKCLFEYDFTLAVSVVAVRAADVELICDAFCVDCEMETEQKTTTFERYSETVRGTAAIKQRAALSEGVSEVCDVTGTVRVDTADTVGSVVRLSGGMDLKLLCLNGESEIVSIDKSLPFEVDFPVRPAPSLRYEPEAVIESASAALLSDNELEFRIQLYAEVAVFAGSREEYLSEMRVDRDRPKNAGRLPVVSVYFAAAGEPVWDIAKRYNVSPERIRELNGIIGDAVGEDKRLLLPRRSR